MTITYENQYSEINKINLKYHTFNPFKTAFLHLWHLNKTIWYHGVVETLRQRQENTHEENAHLGN